MVLSVKWSLQGLAGALLQLCSRLLRAPAWHTGPAAVASHAELCFCAAGLEMLSVCLEGPQTEIHAQAAALWGVSSWGANCSLSPRALLEGANRRCFSARKGACFWLTVHFSFHNSAEPCPCSCPCSDRRGSQGPLLSRANTQHPWVMVSKSSSFSLGLFYS